MRLLEDCCVMPLQLTDLFDRLAVGELPLTPEEARQLWEKHSFSLTPNVHAKLEEADSKKARSYGAPMIDVKDVHYSYESGIEALRGVTLRIREGEFVAILGQNGSGKTTLAKHLNGLLRPTGGEIGIEGVATNAMSAAELGKQVGYVFQNPDHQIFEENILDEVMFGPRMLGIGQEQAQRQAQDALETVGLWERRDEDPFMLTKGLRQKVAVASVLATRPRAIVMDEPTTGLDYSELQGMMSLVKRLNEEGHTIIIITHCIWIAAQYAHRIILMNGGKVVADGPTREIFADEGLLAQADILPPQIVRFSNELGTTMLSVDEVLLYTGMAINLDEDPQNADWPKIARKKRKEENEQ
jgi:energy-coupling factor transport system ATP-binding protein